MREYIALVDKIVPGWDHEPLDYPVAKQDRFWKDDSTAMQCQYCGVSFSMQLRRHHCRLCLNIFCLECCSEALELALCPGAPLRVQRVCCQCFQEAERSKSLVEVRRVIRENHDLEQQIKDIQVATEARLSIKRREEAKLRQEALANGCDAESLDTSIIKRVGSSSNGCSSVGTNGTTSGISISTSASSHSNGTVAIKTPPAHKFTPRETVEANDQLALANRQLLMGLKVAQVRSKKALEKIDITLTVLREAICFGSSNWNVVLQRVRVFLTLRDLKALKSVSKAHRAVVERCKCETKCILEQDIVMAMRPALWQSECLKNEKTRVYLSDLVEEIRTRLDASDSDTEDSDSNESGGVLFPFSQPTAARKPVWLSLLATASPVAVLEDPIDKNTNVWTRAYDLILTRCKASPPGGLEFDAQIQNDVQRTFGVSALRKMKHKTYQKASITAGSDTTTQKPTEVTVESRRSALANVLRSFSSVNTEIGYCQGMDHVAAMLLSVVNWNEPRAFWLLTSLVASPKYELDALYSPGIPHLVLRNFQLERLMAMYLPELYEYLSSMDFPISMFATRCVACLWLEEIWYIILILLVDCYCYCSWLMTLFTNMETLSYDMSLRVFDGFIAAGWKQVFRIALVVLDLLQVRMLTVSADLSTEDANTVKRRNIFCLSLLAQHPRERL